MPVSSFYCDAGHETEERHSMDARPVTVACLTCGATAQYRPTVSPRGLTLHEVTTEKRLAASRDRAADRDVSWRDVRCTNDGCRNLWMEPLPIVDGVVRTDGTFVCEKCGGTGAVSDRVFIDRFSERFPYFDRGLGCVVTSKAHRLEVCRQQGVLPIDGDVDLEGAHRRRRAQMEREEAEYRELEDRYEHDPAFARWRKERDRQRAEGAKIR